MKKILTIITILTISLSFLSGCSDTVGTKITFLNFASNKVYINFRASLITVNAGESVDLTDANNILKIVNEKTRVIYFETPANPNMDIINIGAVRKIVDELNKNRDDSQMIQIVVDNTFATPFCQRPIEGPRWRSDCPPSP